VVEVGCGAGDTAFSLLQLNPDLVVYASDFSPVRVPMHPPPALAHTRRWSVPVVDFVETWPNTAALRCCSALLPAAGSGCNHASLTPVRPLPSPCLFQPHCLGGVTTCEWILRYRHI